LIHFNDFAQVLDGAAILQRKMAEGVGFEPTVGLTQRSISRGAVASNSQRLAEALPPIASMAYIRGQILSNF
jgi:hypothetical protein